MRITIILPTYDRAETLPVALRSILEQQVAADLDVLVVDDGSTDATPELLAEMAARHPQIRVLRQPNAGVTAARNAGLAHLDPQADFVTFLDSDDVMPAGRLASDLAAFAADPALELTYGRMQLTDALDPVTLMPPAGARTALVRAIHLSCGLFRRALIDRIGGFDPEFRQAEDTDYLLRVFESGTRFAQTETLCLYYRRHSGNMTAQLAESRRYFVLALRKSMLRRKADPGLRLVKPDFEVTPLRELGSF